MASLWKRSNSKYWTACFTDPAGRRRKRTTKEVDRRKAQRLAEAWEDAARRRVTHRQAQRVVAELFNAKEAAGITMEQFAHQWLATMKPSVSSSTHSSYAVALKEWVMCLEAAGRKDVALLELSREDVMRYRRRMESRHPATGNHRIKLVKMMLKSARDEGLVFDDPFVGVPPLKARVGEGESRRPFTVAELQQLVAVADDEWRSLILFGLYTGQRLGDLVALRWSQIDLPRGVISMVTKKTGRKMEMPIIPALAEHLAGLAGSDDPKALLHRRAAALVAGAKGKVSTLSRHFGELLEAAGLREVEELPAGVAPHGARGKGRTAKRNLSTLSFHSLRHTARTLLEQAGVPLKTVMDLIGHSDVGSSLHYAHVDIETRRTAAEKLPRLF